MLITASGDGFTSYEDDGTVGLPPSGVVATAAPDPEHEGHACPGSREYRAGG